jgi:ribosome-binding protein aMBF1 (putative translation factor)
MLIVCCCVDKITLPSCTSRLMAHNRKKTKVRVAFGQSVRLRRHKMDISIEKLAEAAGLHPTYVSSVERGERNISIENVVALAKALKCSAKDLMPD